MRASDSKQNKRLSIKSETRTFSTLFPSEVKYISLVLFGGVVEVLIILLMEAEEGQEI